MKSDIKRLCTEQLGVRVQVLLAETVKATPLGSALHRSLSALLRPSPVEEPIDSPSVLVCVDSAVFDRGKQCLQALEGYVELAKYKPEGGYVPPPLIFTAQPEAFRREGFDFPPEFLFDLRRFDLAASVSRLHALGWLWAGSRKTLTADLSWANRHQNRFHYDLLRDFVVGDLRRRLSLDERHHDARSELIDSLSKLRNLHSSAEEGQQAAAEWIRSGPRRKAWPIFISQVKKQAEKELPLLGYLFGATLDEVTQRANSIAKILKSRGAEPDGQQAFRLAEACLGFERALPVRSGSFGCNLPALPPQVLLIDDQAQAVHHKYLKPQLVHPTERSTSRRLDDLWEVHPAPLRNELQKRDLFDFIRNGLFSFLDRKPEAREIFSDLQDKEQVDLVLLDLSMGERDDEELGGLSLLRVLCRRLPTVPVLAFSSFENLRHVIQAVRQGASWYCRKSDPGSALRSLLEITYGTDWLREAHRLEKEIRVQPKHGTPSLSREGDYLLRKIALASAEKATWFSSLGGGIGGARTLRMELSPMQAPVVVKIDRPFRMFSELTRFQRFVNPFIPNRVGRIEHPLQRAGWELGAIAYTFSGLHDGRSGDRIKVASTTLAKLFQRKALAEGEGGLHQPFSYFLAILEELFDQSLVSLRDQQPDGHRRAWRERFYGECRSLREAVEIRLPADAEIVLQEVGSVAATWSGEPLKIRLGEALYIPCCFVEDMESDSITVLCEESSRDVASPLLLPRTRRIKLRGELAGTLTKYRALRPLQHLSVRGIVTRNRNVALEDLCANLYQGRDSRRRFFFPNLNSWRSVFEDSRLIESTGVGAPQKKAYDDFPFSASRVEEVLRLLDVAQDRTGIVHGDLNLGNVLIEELEGGVLISHPWLIDFARTRRDAIAHDYVEFEVDLVTRLMAPELFGQEWRESLVTRVRDFLATFDQSALDFPLTARRDPRLEFFFEAVTYIRRKAAESGIASLDYQALLYFYYLTVQKITQGYERRAREAADRIEHDLGRAKMEADAKWDIHQTRERIGDLKKQLEEEKAKSRRAIWQQVLCSLGGLNAYRFLTHKMVRVSANVAVRIKLRDQQGRELYLLACNERRKVHGRIVFTPIGGTIRLRDGDAIEEELKRLRAEPEAQVANGSRPFRHRLPALRLPEFEDLWLAQVRSRLLPDVAEQAAARLPKEFKNGVGHPRLAGIVCDYDLTDRIGARGELTRRYSTVFDIELTQDIVTKILEHIDKRRFVLATSEEISSGRSSKGQPNKKVLIGANAKALLRAESA